jgi:hypothetical protein
VATVTPLAFVARTGFEIDKVAEFAAAGATVNSESADAITAVAIPLASHLRLLVGM